MLSTYYGLDKWRLILFSQFAKWVASARHINKIIHIYIHVGFCGVLNAFSCGNLSICVPVFDVTTHEVICVPVVDVTTHEVICVPVVDVTTHEVICVPVVDVTTHEVKRPSAGKNAEWHLQLAANL